MTWMTRTVFGSLGVCFLVASASAGQPLNYEAITPGQNRVVLSMGLDPALASSVGYARSVPIGSRLLLLSLELALPVAHLDGRDYRTAIGAQMSVWSFRGLHVAGQGQVISLGTRNDIFDAHGVGADLTLSVGYYGLRGFASLEGGFNKNLATHISHRDWYRNFFYADAVDGWYDSMGGTWHGGVVAGVSLSRFEVAGRIQMQRSEAGHALLPPFGGVLSVAYLF